MYGLTSDQCRILNTILQHPIKKCSKIFAQHSDKRKYASLQWQFSLLLPPTQPVWHLLLCLFTTASCSERLVSWNATASARKQGQHRAQTRFDSTTAISPNDGPSTHFTEVRDFYLWTRTPYSVRCCRMGVEQNSKIIIIFIINYLT